MIELGKKYKTRDGCEVRIYAVDAGGQMPVHGAIKRNSEWVFVTSWSKEGCWSNEYSINDLVEVTPRIQREVWLNVYKSECAYGPVYREKCYADDAAASTRIACVKLVIDCEEGEGL